MEILIAFFAVFGFYSVLWEIKNFIWDVVDKRRRKRDNIIILNNKNNAGDDFKDFEDE